MQPNAVTTELRGSRSNPEPQQLITFRGETKSLAQWAFHARRTPAALWRSIRTVGLEASLSSLNPSTTAAAKHASNHSPWRRTRMAGFTNGVATAR